MKTNPTPVPVSHDWLTELQAGSSLTLRQRSRIFDAITSGEGRLSQLFGPNYFGLHFDEKEEWRQFRLRICLNGLPTEANLVQELFALREQADLHLLNLYHLTPLLRA
ncbi:hypothetical protein [Telluribacter humicola]|uniref:hypothetical protein n=1 Tax=Telluribacter humicola TaxID=1720261 RepID=UPI001A97AEF3|nr:hypothetical protein [Telluribacter humicola]